MTNEEFEKLQTAAHRAETPCGDGVVVWHCWGDLSGEPVVLLHGGSGSWTHWAKNIAPIVDAGFYVLAPDLPGFGESDVTPKGFDADAQVDWIALGIQHLLEDRSYNLVAFSFGCMVASFIAAQQPERVLRAVFVGAPALTSQRGPSLKLKAWKEHPPGPLRVEAHAHNLGVVMLEHPELQSPLGVHIHAANVERDRIPHRRLFQTDVIAQLLPTIRAPLWAMWGTGDALHVGRFERYAAVLATAPQFQTLTLLPRGGHWIQFEAADLFNRTLLPILKQR
jgi:pimeloyl-ACP methyl ester carboxylesterase